jgi:AmmeMemoRadiSam system protein A
MTPNQGRLLLTIARTSIAKALGMAASEGHLPKETGWLHEPGACFITLKNGTRLRGCVGSLEAYRPLLDDVRLNAQAAAFRDPRFSPLRAEEFERIHIEISLLTKPTPLPVENEAAAIARLKPGQDGVLLEFGRHRATFLPQVWEELPDPRNFLAHLKVKAGLAPDFWHPQLLLSVYRVEKLSEDAASLPANLETE